MANKAAGKNIQLELEKKTMILNEIKFEKVGAQQELLLTPDGRKVEEDAQKGKSDNDDEDEGDNDDQQVEEVEKQVSIDHVSSGAKATILTEAKGENIEEIVTETEDGQTIYETEVIIDGKETDIKVAADGKLLGKEVEDEEDDD